MLHLVPVCCLIFVVACLPVFAAGGSVRVLDPAGAPVAGARVTVLDESGRVVSVLSTAADGSVTLPEGSGRVRVEAPGFAPQETALRSLGAPQDIRLRLASHAENVTVTADATPLEGAKASAPGGSLDAGTLTLLNLPELSDNLRVLPGAYVSDTGRRGGLTTMFVRGGESDYNKVIVDGVPVNEDGGGFNFGVVSSFGVGRVETVRGASSILYGSDAMTSVTQLWSTAGATRVPELRFGAEGGTFSTAHGFASLAGAYGRWDYNFFGEQFNTSGQGVNDGYGSSMQGANLGGRWGGTSLRLHLRHANSRSGVQSDWLFPSGALPPDTDQLARQNDFLGSLALTFSPVATWRNTITGFEYNHRLRNADFVMDAGRPYDYPFDGRDHYNRAGFDWQSEVTERAWTRSVAGFHFEDENAFVSELLGGSLTHGLRRNSAVFGEQIVDYRRLALSLGLRWEHNESFGNKAVPRVTASFLIFRGGHTLGGTRMHASYAEGIKAPSFEQTFGITAYGVLPNASLRPEQVRAVEAGVTQQLFGDRWSFSALYFHNLFRDQVEYQTLPVTAAPCIAAGFSSFCSEFVNLNRTLAHGAELEAHGRLTQRLSLSGSYTYTSTQALSAPLCAPGTGCTAMGDALPRRPKHFGSVLATYNGHRWGTGLGGSFVGRRPDLNFESPGIPPFRSVAGYARLDASAWHDITRRITAFATVQNLLNQRYEEVAGYLAYKASFRAGLRFRLGGD